MFSLLGMRRVSILLAAALLVVRASWRGLASAGAFPRHADFPGGRESSCAVR